MSEAFVVDASTAFAWVFPSQTSLEADALLTRIGSGATPVVPSLWFLEVANGLLAAQRRKLLTASERNQALEQLSALSVSVDEDVGRAAFGRISILAEKQGLSVYDAAYLDTALRRKLPLATRDRALVSAARRSRVQVLG